MKKETRAIVMLLAILLPILALYYKHLNLGLDLRGGTYVVLQADEKTGKVESDTMDKVRDIVERRVNSLGVAEPNIQKSGDNRLIVELAGVKNSQAAIDLIGTTAKLEFKLMQEDGSLGETLLTGESIKNATLAQGQLGQPEVSFELNDSGANKFAQITKDNVGKQLAIVLDGKIQSAPKINSEIPGGKGVITTGDQKASQDLVNLLKSGALPVDIKILETRTIGASLGVESIKQTQLAGIIAIILISIFMIAIYKIPGLIADFALYIFGLIVLGVLSAINATITLPGIAGFILSLGMAVDANVIIFERIKDELREGKETKEAIEIGFKKGLPAIIDGNITTLIITTILFFYGTGPVRGFAVTLTIGVLASMFTAIFVTRTLLELVMGLFNIDKEKLFWKGGAK